VGEGITEKISVFPPRGKKYVKSIELEKYIREENGCGEKKHIFFFLNYGWQKKLQF
jgi:hypothetical protein